MHVSFRFTRRHVAILAALGLSPIPAFAADSADLQQIRQEFEALKTQLRQDYEHHIAELENRLTQAEASARAAQASAAQAEAKASAASNSVAPVAAPVVSGAPQSGNAFNPEIAAILSGSYANLKRDPSNYRITGFVPTSDIGPGTRGFSLGESEFSLSANVDQLFYGNLTLSVSPKNDITAEEAFVQTTALPDGFKLKTGRFFSGIGYLNSQHAHTWDFVDSPLVYQAFMGGQYGQEGIQASWVAPTALFMELGSEFGRGASFPGADSQRNKPGSQALFAHLGGDIGISQSWRAGLSWLRNTPQGRTYADTNIDGTTVNNSFTGNSQIVGADFIWKWAPNGNGERQNLKFLGEYFHRRESGQLIYDTANANTQDGYRSSQSGWYLQTVYQFMPAWRIGARYDRLDSGTVDYASNAANLAATNYRPNKTSFMIDWSPSEFSRVRLQAAVDKSRQGKPDQQVFLQYQMSLGAHGAHSY